MFISLHKIEITINTTNRTYIYLYIYLYINKYKYKPRLSLRVLSSFFSYSTISTDTRRTNKQKPLRRNLLSFDQATSEMFKACSYFDILKQVREGQQSCRKSHFLKRFAKSEICNRYLWQYWHLNKDDKNSWRGAGDGGGEDSAFYDGKLPRDIKN